MGARGFSNLQLATSDAEAFALSKLAGKPLRGANQEQFGTVADFLLDAKTGALRFAVVPSGAGAGGETFRLVPMAALAPGFSNDGLNISINRSQWDQVGTMTQQELQGRVSLNHEQLQRMSQQYAVNQPAWAGDASGELIRASQLKGQALKAGNDQVGQIEDIVIDVNHRTAAALLKASGGFAGSEHKFLVPFQQLQVSGDANAGVTTSLTRNDFQQAQTALSPTGYTGAPFTRGAPQLHATASAVQQAVEQAGGRGTVQVTPETWLILRGTVDNEQKRADIERAAQQAAPGTPIDNKITVQR